mgnify:CR=1 FL=1
MFIRKLPYFLSEYAFAMGNGYVPLRFRQWLDGMRTYVREQSEKNEELLAVSLESEATDTIEEADTGRLKKIREVSSCVTVLGNRKLRKSPRGGRP